MGFILLEKELAFFRLRQVSTSATQWRRDRSKRRIPNNCMHTCEGAPRMPSVINTQSLSRDPALLAPSR